MHLCSGVRPQPNEYPVYDTKQFDGKVPVFLEFCRIYSTPSLLSLPGQVWTGLVAPDRFHLKYVLILNFIAGNITVFDIETVLIIN